MEMFLFILINCLITYRIHSTLPVLLWLALKPFNNAKIYGDSVPRGENHLQHMVYTLVY